MEQRWKKKLKRINKKEITLKKTAKKNPPTCVEQLDYRTIFQGGNRGWLYILPAKYRRRKSRASPSDAAPRTKEKKKNERAILYAGFQMPCGLQKSERTLQPAAHDLIPRKCEQSPSTATVNFGT